MAAPGAFIVKERLEGLEARINMALDEAGLKDFSKQIAREAVSGLVDEIINELQDKKGAALGELELERVDIDARLKETQGNFDVAIAEHVTRLESSMVRTKQVSMIALAVSLLAVAISLFL
jgi:hypothetical protein